MQGAATRCSCDFHFHIIFSWFADFFPTNSAHQKESKLDNFVYYVSVKSKAIVCDHRKKTFFGLKSVLTTMSINFPTQWMSRRRYTSCLRSSWLQGKFSSWINDSIYCATSSFGPKRKETLVCRIKDSFINLSFFE